ncbi:MAG: tetratricopeptide repeat protein [Gemmatimonadales bacterium]
MSYSPELAHLAARCAEHPDRLAFAALAEGLRKHGDRNEARATVEAGLARHPDHLPALLVLARIQVDEGDHVGAQSALHRALRIDPSHPVVLETLVHATRTGGDLAAGRAWQEALDASLPETMGPADDDPIEGWGDEMLLSESLAALYRRQGHLDRAREVYAALSARDPDNSRLASERDTLDAEIAASGPLLFDARVTGGTSLADWLGAMSRAERIEPPAATGYDAFVGADAPAARDVSDFDAFQDWLKGLPR